MILPGGLGGGFEERDKGSGLGSKFHGGVPGKGCQMGLLARQAVLNRQGGKQVRYSLNCLSRPLVLTDLGQTSELLPRG
jgi:hypothetical protein